ncbi:MAG: PAS domain S-box protein [Nitrospinae bacterium]|nr:PAS domain S-box protein [Nitrospinota bacterium]
MPGKSVKKKKAKAAKPRSAPRRRTGKKEMADAPIAASLIEKAERYTYLFENLRDYIYSLDATAGVSRELSPAFESITGWRPDEWIGKSFEPLVHPDDIAKSKENFNRAVTEKHPPPNTLRIKKKTGDYVTLEFKGALVTEHKWGKEIFGVARDVTRREAIMAELRESEEKYRSLINNASDLIYTVDMTGNFTSGNEACLALTGYKFEELVGTHFSKVVPAEYLPVIQQNIAKKMRGEVQTTRYEIEVLRKDGIRVPAEISSRMILARGKPAGILGIIRDMSPHKRAEEELRNAKEMAEEATRLKDKFVSLVSHDLRAPLSSVMSYLKLVMDDNESLTSENASMLGRTVAICGGMVNMIDRLLNISRLQTGAIRLRPRFLDARSVAAHALESVSPLAEQKGVELRNEVARGTRLYGDFEMLAEVAQNLVSNAVKFCRKGDTVTVFNPPGRPCSLAVKDTGVGVNPALLPDIFRHEVKTTTPGTAGEPGTGLGLPFCRDIMEAHGGTLEVESVPGAGSVFTLTLPVVRPLLLVVDDNQTDREIIKSHLLGLNVDVIEADGAAEGLKTAAARAPHIVIIDILMPGQDGMSLLAAMKDNPATSPIPVIVVTSDSQLETREEAFRKGAGDFVLKPVDRNDLIPRVNRFLM